MTYQTFGDEKGDSNSSEKLNTLAFPAHLNGKSFLDIGCNEGYFCIAAHERGASPVIGIDVNSNFITKARNRAPFIDYRQQSWDVLPSGPFDVILMSSALHYAKEPERLLSSIHNILSEDGLFILEAGVLADSVAGNKGWSEIKRGPDVVLFPNWALMMESLLSNFAVRVVGRSVRQSGDPVSRFVFHCQKLRPIVLMCSGRSGAGKTTVSQELHRKSIPVFSTDVALMEIATREFPVPSTLNTLIRSKFNAAHIGELVEEIIRLGLAKELASALYNMFPKKERISLFEGYAIHSEAVRKEVIRLLGRDYKVWSLTADEDLSK